MMQGIENPGIAGDVFMDGPMRDLLAISIV